MLDLPSVGLIAEHISTKPIENGTNLSLFDLALKVCLAIVSLLKFQLLLSSLLREKGKLIYMVEGELGALQLWDWPYL